MSIQDLRTPSFDPEKNEKFNPRRMNEGIGKMNESIDRIRKGTYKVERYSYISIALALAAGSLVTYLVTSQVYKNRASKERNNSPITQNLTNVPLTQKIVFDEFDANNDGRLDKNEFERMLREYRIVPRTNSF